MKSVSRGLAPLLGCSEGDGERILLLIRSLFPTVAGQAAGRLHPYSMREGELILVTAEERWLSAGPDNIEQLRGALNRRLGRGVIKRIRVILGDLPEVEVISIEPGRPEEKPSPPRNVAESAAIIRDERTRKAYLELAAGVAALRKRE
jgi:hypothetical protein